MGRILAVVASIVAGFFISACSTLTPEQQESNRQYYEAKERQDKEDYLTELRSKCQGYGYVQGTNAFAQCMQATDIATQAKAAADKQEKDKKDRQDWCNLGQRSMCDNKPKVTSCSSNVLGQTTCVTQ
jgi:hypothetical protein